MGAFGGLRARPMNEIMFRVLAVEVLFGGILAILGVVEANGFIAGQTEFAGLGIGGLAVALALQPVLGNFFAYVKVTIEITGLA